MEEVLQTMIVRFMRDCPVLGSVRPGNSFNVSTTSPARSPHAADITTSTFAYRAVVCWSTVLPAPNGPGMQYVPPTATGKNVSIVRTVVSRVSVGSRRSLKHLIGTLTGQRCIMETETSLPAEPAPSLKGTSVATVSVTP